MDLLWKGPGFTDDEFDYFEYRPQPVSVVQYTRPMVAGAQKFDSARHSQLLGNPRQLDEWLNDVPAVSSVEPSISVLLCPRYLHKGRPRPRDAGVLNYLPFTKQTFIKVANKFHLHHATALFMNRGWPIISRIETSCDGEKAIVYNMRCSNTLDNDIALALTHIPTPGRQKVYAIFFGCGEYGRTNKALNAEDHVESILGRLEFAEEAAACPFTLIATFLELEKIHRFVQVESVVTTMVSLVHNFSQTVGKRKQSKWRDVDDPQNLVGISQRVHHLKNELQSWKTEIEALAAYTGYFATMLEQPIPLLSTPLLNPSEYLRRLVTEYESKIRKCESVLSTASLAFQMETSSLSRQEASKMKALAVLTMIFLPATFVATFMSMNLFNWHADVSKGESVLSPWWYAYFALAIPLTLAVLSVYCCWTPIIRSFQRVRMKDPRHIV